MPSTPFFDRHHELTHTFRAFQEALVGLELQRASELLGQYRTYLQRHIEVEDGLLFPLFEQHVPNPPRGAAHRIFSDEHRKLERLVDELQLRLDNACVSAAQQPPGESLKGQVLDLLERAFLAQGVAEHHHLREETLLVPGLQAVLPEPILTSVWKRFEGQS